MENFYTILTRVGLAKIANSQVTGKKVDLSFIAVGDGGGNYYNPTIDVTRLKREVWRGNIGSVANDETNNNWIVVETVIPAVDGGFFVREVGLFDDAGDLIAIGKYPETYKPVLADGSAKDLYIRMIIEVSNASAVTLKIDPAIVLASRKYVEDQLTYALLPIKESFQDLDHQLAETAIKEFTGFRNGDLSTLTRKDGTVTVITGDSHVASRHDFVSTSNSNSYDYYPGLQGPFFMLRDAIHRNDAFFKSCEEINYLIESPYSTAVNPSADNSYLAPFNGRYIQFFSSVDNDTNEISFPYLHFNKDTNKAYLYMYHNPNNSACSFDIYVDDVYVKTIDNNGTGKLYQGFEPFAVELTGIKAGIEYKISLKNLIQTAAVPNSSGTRSIYFCGVGSKYSPVYTTGRGSQTSQWLVDNLQSKVLDYNPDIVIISIGSNDILSLTSTQYGDNLENIISRIKSHKVNTQIVFVSPPKSSSYTDAKLLEFIQVLKEKSAKYNCFFMDVYELFKNYNVSDWRFDNIHLTKFGSTVLANTLLDLIMPNSLHDKSMVNANLYYSAGKFSFRPDKLKGSVTIGHNGNNLYIVGSQGDKIAKSVEKVDASTIRLHLHYSFDTFSQLEYPTIQQRGSVDTLLFPRFLINARNYADFELRKLDGSLLDDSFFTTDYRSYKFLISF